MRLLTVATIVCVLGAGIGSVVAADDPVLQPILKFMDSFNKGDVAGAAATHAANADLSITDEVAPYLWRGAKAFESWSAALCTWGGTRESAGRGGRAENGRYVANRPFVLRTRHHARGQRRQDAARRRGTLQGDRPGHQAALLTYGATFEALVDAARDWEKKNP